MQQIAKFLMFAGVLLTVGNAWAGWTAKDIGVGIYTSDDPPKILIRDSKQWGQKDLDHDVFGLWMQGPNPDTYRNKYGTPIYMYKYRISKDGGESKAFGPYGFSLTGWGLSSLSIEKGSYKLEMFVVERETEGETLIGTREYKIVEGTVVGSGGVVESVSDDSAKPQKPDEVPDYLKNTKWKFGNVPVRWVFKPDGTMMAENGEWAGTYERKSADEYKCNIKFKSSGEARAYDLRFSDDGKTLTAYQDGKVTNQAKLSQ